MQTSWILQAGQPRTSPSMRTCTAHLRAEPEGLNHTWRALLSAALCMVNTAPAGSTPHRSAGLFKGMGGGTNRGRRQKAADKKVSEPCGPWALQADPRFSDCRGALRRGCRAAPARGRKEQALLSYHSPSTMARSCSDRRRRRSAASSASSRAICASASSAACRCARLTFFPRLHLAFICTNWHSYEHNGIHKHSCKYIVTRPAGSLHRFLICHCNGSL